MSGVRGLAVPHSDDLCEGSDLDTSTVLVTVPTGSPDCVGQIRLRHVMSLVSLKLPYDCIEHIAGLIGTECNRTQVIESSGVLLDLFGFVHP